MGGNQENNEQESIMLEMIEEVSLMDTPQASVSDDEQHLNIWESPALPNLITQFAYLDSLIRNFLFQLHQRRSSQHPDHMRITISRIYPRAPIQSDFSSSVQIGQETRNSIEFQLDSESQPELDTLQEAACNLNDCEPITDVAFDRSEQKIACVIRADGVQQELGRSRADQDRTSVSKSERVDWSFEE